MGMDAQSAAPAIAAASQAQQGGAGAPQQNPMLARLMPLLQQRMQQQPGIDQMNRGVRAMPASATPLGQQPNPGLGGGMRPGAEPALDPASGGMVSAQPQKPAWQQLQEAGIGGQGSAAGNQAALAQLQGRQLGVPVESPSGGIIAPDQVPGGGQGGGMSADPMVALRKKIMDAAGAGAVRGEARGARPTPRPMPTQNIPAEEPAPGAPPQGSGVGGNVRQRGAVQRGRRMAY